MAVVPSSFLSLLVLCGGLCYAAVSPLNQIQESYPDSAVVTRVRQAETRIEQQLQGKSSVKRKLALDQILLDVVAPISEVDPQFLSVTIDSGDISRNWSGITFTAQRIINMAQGLTPAMLRVGGTSGDFLIFNSSTAETVQQSNFTMTPQQWDEVNKFVETVGWDFVFGLNALLRTPYPNGSWDSDNGRMLLSYSTSKNYTVQWELGNEPDMWGTPIPAEDHAKDFLTLRDLVAEEKTLGKMLIGPDVAYNRDYFTEFIQSLPEGVLSATTYHQYYGNGNTAKLAQCYDVNLLDSYIHDAIDFQGTTEALQPQANVWLGETSSFYDGGAPHLSDTYVAGFMWLDKLGVAAVVGHKRVFRQDFIGGSYSLLDGDQNPLPDYWLSLLYKKLVGTKVLYIKGSLDYGRNLRSYAHCAKPPYPAGSVVLLLLNTNFTTATVELLNEELASSYRDVFWLSPPAGDLTSTSVLLNGVLLELVDNRDLPHLVPAEDSPGSSFSVPSISFGFVVFKDTKIPACTS
ncbi:Heparanase [Geodia barretti]|uniref:Heparanase n=1 Tax=Geodia barretti TaxID=519541 RepID=A0AA35TUV4_GEOBA|nr:Heparanase [Geodia barretti]